MTRADEVLAGCNKPDLVVACHCGFDCPEVPTYEGERVLVAARSHLEDLVEYRPLYRSNPQTANENAILGASVEVLEDLMGLECEACNYCSEFVARSCELCGSLAGERHAIAQVESKEAFGLLYFEACVDCLMFVANGDLPDG